MFPPVAAVAMVAADETWGSLDAADAVAQAVVVAVVGWLQQALVLTVDDKTECGWFWLSALKGTAREIEGATGSSARWLAGGIMERDLAAELGSEKFDNDGVELILSSSAAAGGALVKAASSSRFLNMDFLVLISGGLLSLPCPNDALTDGNSCLWYRC